MHAPILQKETLAPGITRMVVAAPQVAAHAAAGQFVILRAVPEGERIPLTIADFDAAAGTVTVIYQVVGGTTLLLDSLLPGDCLPTFAGPLGRPSEVAGFARAAVIGLLRLIRIRIFCFCRFRLFYQRVQALYIRYQQRSRYYPQHGQRAEAYYNAYKRLYQLFSVIAHLGLSPPEYSLIISISLSLRAFPFPEGLDMVLLSYTIMLLPPPSRL